MGEVTKLYQKIIPVGGFILDIERSRVEDGEFYYTLPHDKGKGYFWNYINKDTFVIQKQDFCFYDDFFLESSESDFFAVQYYFSVSGEELHPYRQLSPNSLRGYVGSTGRTFQAIYHKNISIRSVSISIMPDFYNNYLKEKLCGEYIDPQNAFNWMMTGVDFPPLVALLKQIATYSSRGLAAKLFYEGKVLEALALIFDEAKRNQRRSKTITINKKDEENLKAVTAYINHHISLPIAQEKLCKIACMGNTKLKTLFKEYFGCSITDYIIKTRIDQAQHLLIGTELSISEVSQAVGYKRSESFAKQFHKITGFLPREYRKISRSFVL